MKPSREDVRLHLAGLAGERRVCLGPARCPARHSVSGSGSLHLPCLQYRALCGNMLHAMACELP